MNVSGNFVIYLTNGKKIFNMNEMFSINDTIETGEEIEVQVKNYAEIGHKHEISDVNGLDNRLTAIEEKLGDSFFESLNERISTLESKLDELINGTLNVGKINF